MKKFTLSRYVLILVIYLGSMLCSNYFNSFYYRGIPTLITPYIVQIIAYMLMGVLVGKGCTIHCTAKEKPLRLGVALVMLIFILIPVMPLGTVQQMSMYIIETHSYLFFALGVGYIFSTLKSRA